MPSAARATIVLAALVLVVVACGTTDRTPTGVEIRGAVFTVFRDGLPCVEGRPAALRPDELSGMTLRFANSHGVPLGVALTGPLRAEPMADGCRFLADYRVIVPAAEGYHVEFEPPEPRTLPGGGYYDGARQLGAQDIRHDQLAAAAFEWNFEAPAAFVVP